MAEEIAAAAEKERPKLGEGPALKKILEIVPEAMKELMDEFVKFPELTDRSQTKLRIKAILDLVSVNTQYPMAKLPQMPQERPQPQYLRQDELNPMGIRAIPGIGVPVGGDAVQP